MEFSYRIILQLLCCKIVHGILVIMQTLESVSEALQILVHQIKIPFLGKLAVYGYRNHYVFNQVIHHIHNVVLHIVAEKNSAALFVYDFSLLVHYVVILENVFTYFKVAAFNFLLCVFNGFGKHSCSNRLILHAESVHNGLYSFAAEEPH